MGIRDVFRRLCHLGPLSITCASIYIFMASTHMNNMWFPPNHSWIALISNIFGTLIFFLTFYHFFAASLRGPGYVPLGWQPRNEADKKYLPMCDICKGYKPPRAQHCAKCGRCVLKQDHHCPWINNCLGHFNLFNFIMTCLLTTVSALHSIVLFRIGFYRNHHIEWYYENGDSFRLVTFTDTTYFLCTYAYNILVGIFAASLIFFVFQLSLILRNRTAIEYMLIREGEKCKLEKRTIHPYHLGLFKNFKSVFWDPPGDGIEWPLVPGYNQHSFIMQQLILALEAQMSFRRAKVVKRYSGSWVPVCSQWPQTWICIPWAFERRMPLKMGQFLWVKGGTTYWGFGQMMKAVETQDVDVKPMMSQRPEMGWFPMSCVEETTEGPHHHVKDHRQEISRLQKLMVTSGTADQINSQCNAGKGDEAKKDK